MSGLVCVASSKGSPGATTLAAALASSVTAGRGGVLLVDADPDGGDLAALLGVATTPGVVTLAAATRHRFDPDDIARHTQAVGDSVALLAAPTNPDHAASALTSLGRPFAESIGHTAAVADLGRWRPNSAAAPLAGAATTTVLIVHPTVSGVAHARWAFEDLTRRCRRVVVATRGERPYGPAEVAAAIGAEDAVVVPVDRSGVSVLSGGRWARRAPLARTARALGEQLGLTEAAGLAESPAEVAR